MNWWLLLGVAVTILIEAGHATAGKKMYLAPAVAEISNIEARTTMKFVWHLADVTFIIIIVGALCAMFYGSASQIMMTAGVASAFFAGLVVVHLWFSLRSGIERAPVKLFQWSLFLAASIAYLMAAIS